MNQLKSKHVLVTGATSGIGKALVCELLSLGAKVSFCGRSEQKLSQLIESLPQYNHLMFFKTFDLEDLSAIPSFICQATAHQGQVDILINCAGANSARGKVSDIDLVDLQSMVNVNMLAPFVFIKEVLNHSMLPLQQGMIINVLSTVCLYSNEGIGSYTSSKAGLDALIKVLRKEVREQGVKVCSIYPGGVDTPFRSASKPEYLKESDIVNAILTMAQQSENSVIDELVVRPMVEKNF